MYIALTDTFRSSTFFKEFASSPQVAERWKGLRQDSGDPFEFAREAKKVYEGLGISVADKVLVFSDGLNVEKTLEIQKANQEEFGFQGAFKSITSALFLISMPTRSLTRPRVTDFFSFPLRSFVRGGNDIDKRLQVAFIGEQIQSTKHCYQDIRD